LNKRESEAGGEGKKPNGEVNRGVRNSTANGVGGERCWFRRIRGRGKIE